MSYAFVMAHESRPIRGRNLKIAKAIGAALVVGVLLLSFLVSAGHSQAHVTCRGALTEGNGAAKIRHPDARLGMTFHELKPIIFWADHSKYYDYSRVHITESGKVERWMQNSLPLDGFNSTFVSSFRKNEGGISEGMFYDNISGLVQLVWKYEGGVTTFEGFCEVTEQAITK